MFWTRWHAAKLTTRVVKNAIEKFESSVACRLACGVKVWLRKTPARLTISRAKLLPLVQTLLDAQHGDS